MQSTYDNTVKMAEENKKYMSNDNTSQLRVGVIDGIRVLAIMLIAWFHIWQQSWLAPYITIGKKILSFMPLPRSGYLWVDMFILLSAFQLFLPHARQMVSGGDTISTKAFYINRAKRILPSYFLSVVICLYIAIFVGEYSSFTQVMKDFFTHITFTYTFFTDTYLYTKINVVLWTVAILVQFYLIFPWLAKAFKRFPTSTFLIMCAIGTLFRVVFVNTAEYPAMFVNQLPAFFDVFAFGMAGAYAYVALEKTNPRRFAPLFTMLSVASLVIIYLAMKNLSFINGAVNLQHWQGANRSWLAFVFVIFVLSTAYAVNWYRKIFSNKVAVFLSSISFNFYIWHQYLAVKLKQWNFPYSQYDYPNISGDIRWQYLYTFFCFGLSLLLAWLITRFYEGKLVPLIYKKTKDK